MAHDMCSWRIAMRRCSCVHTGMSAAPVEACVLDGDLLLGRQRLAEERSALRKLLREDVVQAVARHCEMSCA